jgi:hypothetical protein
LIAPEFARDFYRLGHGVSRLERRNNALQTRQRLKRLERLAIGN